jgi:hypothetical protein
MLSESQVRDAIDVVLASDLSDSAYGNAVIARVLAHRPDD